LDIFLLKYSLDGNCLWSRREGGTGDDNINKLAFDHKGNIYMCGTTSSSASFDNFEIPEGGFLQNLILMGIANGLRIKLPGLQL